MTNLAQLKRLAEAAAEFPVGPGEWTVDRAGQVCAPSLKGGETRIIELRGWGYLTGGGHGALGRTGDEAVKLQDALAAHIAAANPATILKLIACVEAAERWMKLRDAPPPKAACADRFFDHAASAHERENALRTALASLKEPNQ